MRKYDPYDPEIRRDPYEWFTRLRQTCPVNHHVLSDSERELITVNPMVARPTDEFWQVFSYEHAVGVLQNPTVFSSLQGQGPERADPPNEVGMLIFADPPHHTRHRQIIAQALTPKRINALEPRVREIAREMIGRFAGDGHADVVGEFTAHFPGVVFAEILGVSRDDTDKFERWAQAVVDAFGGDPEILQRSVESVMEMAQYFMALKAERLAARDDGTPLPDDLFTDLLTKEYEGRTFDDMELMLVLPILIVGGNETTASALANGLYELATRPDQLAMLYNDRSMIPLACEEIVRFQTTPQCLFRNTTTATEIAGVPIPADAKVGVMYGSANRDEKQFTDPDRFDITRPAKELRQHLGFGRGIHACIGASLGRMLMRVGFETMLEMLPDLRLDPDHEPTMHTSFIVRTWSQLHMTWSPEAKA
ncbi:MAG TPA: cytochrome P450 [Pseudonocardia sp.]|nr:cytochrome P450 [Pseudonocardia sp.]